MRFVHWLGHELRSLAGITLFFLAWFIVIMTLKDLLLAQYGIAFSGLSVALVGALVTAKIVIVLEKVRLAWLSSLPAAVDVAARTVLYTFATLLLLLAERAFEARGEHGGFLASAAVIFENRDIHRVWATAIGVGLAFLTYNAFAVLRRELGGRRLAAMYIGRPERAGGSGAGPTAA